MSALPTQAELNELLDYNPETGVLTWKARDIRWFSRDGAVNPSRAQKVFNTRFSGKRALSTPGEAGRRQGYLLGVMEKAHRVIWKMVYGTTSDTVDHIDGDASNNRLKNLRDVTQSGNMKNTRLRADNKTGVHGVFFDKSRGLYMAYANSEGKRKYYGRHGTLDAAIAARNAGAANLGGFHENHGRAAA